MSIKKRSVTIAGHATSITIEDEFWDAFNQIAADQDISIPKLIEHIDRNRKPGQNLSSAMRIYCLKYFQEK